MLRALTPALFALAAVVAAAALALADTSVPIDTEVTPAPKTSPLWTQIAGASYGSDSAPTLSPTPATVDFFTVGFRNSHFGFAAGAECTPGTSPDSLDPCTRYPVVYQYTDAQGARSWSRVGGLPGADKPGFIGSLAFIGPDEVLAVGGTGRYPRREPARQQGQSDSDYAQSDPAGRGRAWLYKAGQWTELDLSQWNAQGMHGMSALGCSPRPSEDGLCFGGGYQQLWKWQNDEFVKAYTHDSPPSEVEDKNSDPNGFLFRVRDIHFFPGADTPTTGPQAAAVTSGCCASGPTQNVARLLLYDGAKWSVHPLTADLNGDVGNAPPQRQTLPDSYYSFAITGGGTTLSTIATPGGPPDLAGSGVAGPEPAARIATTPVPNSLNSGATQAALGVVSTTVVVAGIPDRNSDATGDLMHEVVHPDLSAVRLVAGDGDFQRPPPPDVREDLDTVFPGTDVPDGVMDWAVGSLTGGALPGEGIAYTTTDVAPTPTPLDCPGYADQLPSTACKPADPTRLQDRAASRSLFAVGSWALNAFRFVGSSGTGWAVGDKGAIVEFGNTTVASGGAAEVNPPALGPPEDSPFADLAPYDSFRTPTAAGAGGSVPSLGARPLEHLAQPVFVSAGSPEPTRQDNEPAEDVNTLVTSADGSEGWALGFSHGLEGSNALTTLYHYDGNAWRRCDPDGIPGLRAADPACASLAALRRATTSSGRPDPVRITTAARIPSEAGNDPAAGSDFEVIAFGTPYRASPHSQREVSVMRYRNGRWAPDPAAMDQLQLGDATPVTSVAFASPDDGWLTAGTKGVYRFTGGRWLSCKDKPAACDDTAGKLASLSNADTRLTKAGDRVYLYGTRAKASGGSQGIEGGAKQCYPLIAYHDAGGGGWHAGGDGTDGSLDPGAGSTPTTAEEGAVTALSVTQQPDGSFFGWAAGEFGPGACESAGFSAAQASLSQGGSRRPAGLMQLAGGHWQTWDRDNITHDYSLYGGAAGALTPQLVVPAGQSTAGTVLDPGSQSPGTVDFPAGPAMRFDGSDWRPLRTPFAQIYNTGTKSQEAVVRAVAPDAHGGSWWAVRQVKTATGPHNRSYQQGTFFYDYTDRVNEPVFTDVAHPIRENMTSASAGPEGQLWVGTAEGTIYRHDRIGGWDRVLIRGWDPGRLVTNPSPIYAVAAGPDGEGLAVGRAGRIADITGGRAVLDAAAGKVCGGTSGQPPCGTSHNLDAAALAPDGSALIAGADRILLWRPPGGAFRAVTPPSSAVSATITGIAMPSPDRAWLCTDTGEIYSGTGGASGSWTWTLEDQTPDGVSLAVDTDGESLALRAIAIDASGAGYAVGDRGLILRRSTDGDRSWTRLDSGRLDNLDSVTLAPGGASAGALVGGDAGLVLTLADGRFEVARPADAYDPITAAAGSSVAAQTVGVAIEPGTRPGEIEAWALSQVPASATNRKPGPGAVWHYSSDPNDPLLSADARARPLPDTPAPRPGELRFAAFGKSDCAIATDCSEPTGTGMENEVIAQRIVDALGGQMAESTHPLLALFTGDVDGSAGGAPSESGGLTKPTDLSLIHNRWRELVADPMLQSGLPLFATLGQQDLSYVSRCQADCSTSTSVTGVGNNFAWRQAFASMPAPWGAGSAPKDGDLLFEPVGDSGAPTQNVTLKDPSGQVGDQVVPLGGARTHYAFDIERDGHQLARVIVVDSALGSLSAGDSQQNPVEDQQTWLKSVVCRAGVDDVPGQICTRPADEQAVVLSEDPTYSYGPGTTATESDATTFEAILMQYHANVVVSGRLGWNGRYWATAPGLHCPAPGAAYTPDSDPPHPDQGCSQASDASTQAQDTVSEALQGTGAPPPPADPTGAATASQGILPFVVAASAGGQFGPDGQSSGAAGQGFWHGYTVVRLAADGDPAKTIVEQRPVFDWLSMTASTHVLQPGQHAQLQGEGREPVGMDQPVEYDRIDSPAITHRYDLLEADPTKPYLPKEDADGNYIPLDPSVGYVDPQIGKVQTGKGNHGRVYAIGLLSVGDKVATWPLVFEPRRSFVAKPPNIITATIPPAIHEPPLKLLGASAESLPSTPPAAPPVTPTVANLQFPQMPAIPNLPPPAATPVNPPAPPAPPPPPASTPPSGLNLLAKPVGLNVAPPTSPVPPPSPPINPAPPGGARKEARQRQAAAAKSEEGGGRQGATNPADAQSRIDPVDSPNASMTRRDPGSDRYAFTALRQPAGQSAWSRDALDGAGIAVIGLILALAFSLVRPTTRRLHPQRPAAAWVVVHARRRSQR